MHRRHFLKTLAVLPFCLSPLALVSPARAASPWEEERLSDQIKALEMDSGGRLGISLRHATRGQLYSLRGDERFPLCSTFKALLAGHVLYLSVKTPGLLRQPIVVNAADIVPYSPTVEPRVGSSMTVEDLCVAALTLSDNTAANLLLRVVGGPQALRGFTWTTLNDPLFRLDRWEPECNAVIPQDPRDTSTPNAVAMSIDTLLLKDVLPEAQKKQLLTWMRHCRTGEQRIRAGVPTGWQVANRSGSGDYGITNDIALLEPPQGEPLILALYYMGPTPDAPKQEQMLAEVTRQLCGYRW